MSLTGWCGAAAQTLANNNAAVTYLYCGNAYLGGGGLQNLQDGQHPSQQGYQDLGGCIEPVVAQYVGWSGTTSSSSSSSSGGSGRSSQGARLPISPWLHCLNATFLMVNPAAMRM